MAKREKVGAARKPARVRGLRQLRASELVRLSGKGKTLTVRVHEEVYRRLQVAARDGHVELSDYVRESLAVQLDLAAERRQESEEQEAASNGAAADA